MAKRAGIKVEEFGFGLPPRLWGKKKGETIYSINWIPFGGFVRMLGEDAGDSKMMKEKRSFIAQSVRSRVLVIVAGVVMNFLLAWFLLTIGFTFGMEPLLTPDDVYDAVDNGVVHLTEGAEIKNVEAGSKAESVGFKSGDFVVAINDSVIDSDVLALIADDPNGHYKVRRGDESVEYKLSDYNGSLGVEFGNLTRFPRIKVFSVNKKSAIYDAGMREGDVILRVDGREVYALDQYEKLIRGKAKVEYDVYRDGAYEKFIIETGKGKRVIISNVVPGQPAAKVGVEDGDVVVSVNGKEFFDSEEMVNFIKLNADKNLAFIIDRDGEEVYFEIAPEEGRIGVLLSELIDYSGEKDMSLYNVDLLSTVVGVDKIQYPVHKAVYHAFTESVRMAGLTVKMFGGFVKGFFTRGEVPEGVAGPVGIAQMTHVFVNEGIIPLLRFVAILSLSLAVINILPFPALDGGRLLFIIVELLIGKKVNQKWESMIHALGYVVILTLILAVTYSDILHLFAAR